MERSQQSVRTRSRWTSTSKGTGVQGACARANSSEAALGLLRRNRRGFRHCNRLGGWGTSGARSGGPSVGALGHEDIGRGRSYDEDSQPEDRVGAYAGSIGAEYGEGFVEFSLSGDTEVDVEMLNRRLEVRGAERIRHSSIAPVEAYGLIFTLDGVIADTLDMQRHAWKQLAEEEGLKWPEIERPYIFESAPERVITEILHWTRDFAYARKLGWRLSELYAETFKKVGSPLPGAKQWLETCSNLNIPRALVSAMPRESVLSALDRMGLTGCFDAHVTAEDDMDTCASQLLSASLKLSRPPRKCVAFACSPRMVTAAHNCTMKAVAVTGHNYRHYDLRHADLTCSTMRELTIINLRRLFSMDGYGNFMDLQAEQVQKATGTTFKS